MENGLQVIIKIFNEIEEIHLLEFFNSDEKLLIIGKDHQEGLKFIVWDLCNTGKVELPIKLDNFPMENLGTRLVRTPGNILQINDDGTVSSVLKKVENELKQIKENAKKEKEEKSDKAASQNIKLKNSVKESNGKHVVSYDENINFEPIVNNKEPWVLDDYERNSYCLYQNKKGSEIEILQLIVGSSTVQIWHQIQDKSKNKDDLPNKGEPFLEYIWTNRIPVNQEREKTRLHIEDFKYETNELNDKLPDLKVYWHVRDDEEDQKNEKIVKKVEYDTEKEDEEIDKMEKRGKKKSISESSSNIKKSIVKLEKNN